MTNGQKVKIIDMTILPSAEAGRMGKKDLVITYQDDNLRARIILIPTERIEGKSEEERLALIADVIRSQEGERRQFIGREISV